MELLYHPVINTSDESSDVMLQPSVPVGVCAFLAHTQSSICPYPQNQQQRKERGRVRNVFFIV